MRLGAPAGAPGSTSAPRARRSESRTLAYETEPQASAALMSGSPGSARAAGGPGDGVLEVEDAAIRVSAETSQRLACDASVVTMHHDADGQVLDGRKTRTIPTAIRRALSARDTRCQFLGCSAKRCDAHHIDHWMDGGPTSFDNLVLVCRQHHRLVHEGGFTLRCRTRGLTAWRGGWVTSTHHSQFTQFTISPRDVSSLRSPVSGPQSFSRARKPEADAMALLRPSAARRARR